MRFGLLLPLVSCQPKLIAADAAKKLFYVLEPPLHLQSINGVHYKCTDFGHMYSFEFTFTEFFKDNPHYVAETPDEADFLVLSHCVTYVYHVLRYGFGYNTVELTWEALRIAQEEYLLPIVRWAESLPVYRRTGGRNFVICFAMDKGRVDYPLVDGSVRHWHALTTVGDTSWLVKTSPWMPQPLWLQERTRGAVDPCQNRTSVSIRSFVYYPQDVVIPVPTAFAWTERSTATDRRLLLFYAGSPNSCTRAFVDSSFEGVNMSDVLVTRTVPRHLYSDYLYSSRYCLVPDGFSSISARLYEVFLHGCVPVIISEAFTPPYASQMDWTRLAVFLRRQEVPYAAEILRALPDWYYLDAHDRMARVASFMQVSSENFWQAILHELATRAGERRG